MGRKIDKDIFHSAHSASLLTLPFHSAHSASLLTLPFHSARSASLLTLPFHSARSASLLTLPFRSANFTISFCSFCQFANFTEPITMSKLTIIGGVSFQNSNANLIKGGGGT